VSHEPILQNISFMVFISIPTLLHWKSNIMLHHNIHSKNVDIIISAHDALLK